MTFTVPDGWELVTDAAPYLQIRPAGSEVDGIHLFRDAVATHRDALAARLETRSIQTNEVGRSAALLPKVDGQGRVAAREVMVVTPGISAIIREAKTHQIYSAIQTGGKQGMCTMEQSLTSLYQAGLITAEDALSKANHPQELKSLARLE